MKNGYYLVENFQKLGTLIIFFSCSVQYWWRDSGTLCCLSWKFDRIHHHSSTEEAAGRVAKSSRGKDHSRQPHRE